MLESIPRSRRGARRNFSLVTARAKAVSRVKYCCAPRQSVIA